MTLADSVPPAPSRGRLWLFRLAALTLVPMALLLAIEFSLRLAGVGEPTRFFVPAANTDNLTPNQKYGWRFFPKALARAPVPFLMPKDKGDAVRIFVIGGSAARGTPDSAYSFGRVLEVLLEKHHPGTRFEVLNAAMTAINSHVALDIVRACARHEPDLFIVYLGNNEVVGPFGAGTVFGAFSPHLKIIRASIAARATRLGQLAGAALVDRAEGPKEWRGMEMFLEQRVAHDDPRLAKVRDHFQRNLEEMVAAARGVGAQVLFSTVATNLRDQPPFASLHRPGLQENERQQWLSRVEDGAKATEDGDPSTALTHWRAAEEIDDHPAELHFRIGQALLALGRDNEAIESLKRARDRDVLRFRADSQLNEIIRQVATSAGAGVAWVDADRLFTEGTGDHPPLPGRRLFHEHVHFNFEGNVALASAMIVQLQPLLRLRETPEAMPVASRHPDPSSYQEDVAIIAERLALTDFDRWALEREILDIVSRPPFTDQLGHATDLEQRRLRLGRRQRQLDGNAWREAETRYQHALARDADDLEIRRRFAQLLQARGRHREAAEQWRRLIEQQPAVDSWRASLATVLAAAGDGEAALTEHEQLRQRAGDSADLQVHRATLLESIGRSNEAEEAYRQALQRQPDHKLARFNLATLMFSRGEIAEAEQWFRDLLERHDFAPAHHNLGRCLEQRGQVDDAITAYRRAIQTDPGLSTARNSLALALDRQGKVSRAITEYRVLLAYDPDYALAHFNLADLLLSRGRAAESMTHYRRGLMLNPDNAQARANLEIAQRLHSTHRQTLDDS